MDEKQLDTTALASGATNSQSKNPIETLSKEEIINKYKGLLGIAKKAKQAKDELTEENRKLKEALSRSETQKEADKNALLTMKEMVEEFTANKLLLATQLDEQRRKSKTDGDALTQLNIENESLKRQLDRLSEDNDSLLGDIDRMEDQLKKVNILGIEQKKHLVLLELEVNKLKEAESCNAKLQQQLTTTTEENKTLKEAQNTTSKTHKELSEKYASLKQINSEQRKKFNALKDRFVEVHRKLKQLKECKRVLLETQHEYSDAVSKWQQEIINASRQLCSQMNALKTENEQLQRKLKAQEHHSPTEVSTVPLNITDRLRELQRLSAQAFSEQKEKSAQFEAALEENNRLRQSTEANINLVSIAFKLRELQRLSEVAATEQCEKSAQLNEAQEENSRLRARLAAGSEPDNLVMEAVSEPENLVREAAVSESENVVREANSEPENVVREAVDSESKNVVKEVMVETKAKFKTESSAEPEEHSLEHQRLTQELRNLKIQLCDKEENYKALQLVNSELQLKSSRHDELENKIHSVLVELSDCQLEYQPNTAATKSLGIDELHDRLQEQMYTISQLKLQNENYQTERSQILESTESFEREKHELLTKLSQLEAASQNIETAGALEETLHENNKLHADLQGLRQTLETLQQENCKLLEQLRQQALAYISDAEIATKSTNNATELQVSLLNCRQSRDALQTRYEQKEREHADLLGEMRELNEALKTRGDVISRQQEKQQELTAELSKTSGKLQQLEVRLSESEQTLATKDERVREITHEITEARSKVEELKNACTRNEEQVRMLSEELQSLRSGELANVDAQSDILSNSTISRNEELSRLREVDESYEEKYNKLRGLAVKLKRKLQEQTNYIAELEQQQSNSNSGGRRDLEDYRKRTQELEYEREQTKKTIETLKTENQKLRTSRKQANVLNLEIEAAEKSLSDVSARLAAKSEELTTLRDTYTTKENTIEQLRKEIGILEAAKEAEGTHARELKAQIDRLQTQIKDVVHSKQAALHAGKELEQTQERLRLEVEESRLELAANTSKHEVALSAAHAEQQQLSRRLMDAEERLRTTAVTLKATEDALHDLRIEYVDYKVKAQSVLRKNQTRDTCKERELEEEIGELRGIEKQLQTNAQMQANIIAEGDKQIALLREDNENLQRRIKDTLHVVEALREQNDQLALENRAQLQVAQESLRNHRQQIENLDECHKAQLHELEIGHARQIALLKSREAKAAAAIRMPPSIGAVARTAARTPPEQSKIDFLLMEREDAEGSEEAVEALASLAANRKISTSSRRSQHDFMPLDELLSVPMNTISDTVITITSASFGGVARSSDVADDVDGSNSNRAEQMHVELHATKERLQIQESRVRHLTALLSENEQDLAKLTQMNDMLKEELRRQERAEEREKHMHNSEYLKNIIIKFLTLNNGDERTRLVPVLNTILKLSRNETEMLNCVAKGQKVATDGSSRSWGNFLPSWGNNN